MKQGLLKYLLSFFSEIPIETTSSKLNPKLEIVYSTGRYKLNTTSATYSFEDNYSSFRIALHSIRQQLKSYQSALVLGLGLGSIPFILLKKHHFKGSIKCVDVDPVIIQLAGKYFPIQPIPDSLEFILSDAYEFLHDQNLKYDLIAVDLFIDRNIPSKFHNDEFLFSLKNAVAPGGTVLFSRLKENLVAERELNANLKKIFPEGQDIDTPGNLILCWQAPGI